MLALITAAKMQENTGLSLEHESPNQVGLGKKRILFAYMIKQLKSLGISGSRVSKAIQCGFSALLLQRAYHALFTQGSCRYRGFRSYISTSRPVEKAEDIYRNILRK